MRRSGPNRSSQPLVLRGDSAEDLRSVSTTGEARSGSLGSAVRIPGSVACSWPCRTTLTPPRSGLEVLRVSARWLACSTDSWAKAWSSCTTGGSRGLGRTSITSCSRRQGSTSSTRSATPAGSNFSRRADCSRPRTDRLVVNRRDRTALVHAISPQIGAVQEALGDLADAADPPVSGALCFVNADWGLFTKPFVVHDILITWPKALAQRLRSPGPLSGERIGDWLRGSERTCALREVKAGTRLSTTEDEEAAIADCVQRGSACAYIWSDVHFCRGRKPSCGGGDR